jgi:hypothetical protein
MQVNFSTKPVGNNNILYRSHSEFVIPNTKVERIQITKHLLITVDQPLVNISVLHKNWLP